MIGSPIPSTAYGRSDQRKAERIALVGDLSMPRRKKVLIDLIADDSLVCLSALSMKLRSHGYEVIACRDATRAVGLATHHRPDLILLDINFPPDQSRGQEEAWDGLTILHWLRRLEDTKHTPVIIMSGENPARYRASAFAAGAAGFLEKPIRPHDLLLAVGSALRSGSEGRV